MNVNQIYTLLNTISSQMYGESAVAVEDLSGVISLGSNVLSSENSTEKFLTTLVDRIGKTVVRTLDYEGYAPNLLNDEFEFGAVLQKINVQPFEAQVQNAWNVGQSDFEPDNYAINKPQVSQTFFKDVTTWSIPVTIPDVMLKTAFTSAQALDTFINAIFDAISKSIQMKLDYMAQIAINNFVGEKINGSNGVINLVSKYNTAFGLSEGSALTADSAIESPDFLRFSGKIIRNYIKYLSRPSILYNTGGLVRATQRDNLHVIMLTDYVSSYTTNLQSNTFNDELTELPLYTEIPYLQGIGTAADTINFKDLSTINIKTSSGAEITESYVVGILADRQAIGTTIYDRFSAADRNNRDRYTNYTEGATIGYFNDLSENGIIFTLN